VEAALAPHASHPFVAFLLPRLVRFRALYSECALPMGFIHGDGFLDNALFASNGDLTALVDWEDSCIAPYVLDVAVCVSAACFTAENELQQHRCAHILRGYASRRPLGEAETAALADFMWAGALACGFYRCAPRASSPVTEPCPRSDRMRSHAYACLPGRWREFNVNRPESTSETKEAYLIMQRRCEKLEATPLEPAAWLAMPP